MSRILVIDDDPHILRTLEIMLVDDGYDVATAGTGEAGLERLAEAPADVAFVDLQLPGMSGIDVLKQIRAQHDATEVVIITAFGTIESAVEAMREGAYDFLTKPFTPAQARHRLQQILRLKGLQETIADLQRRVGDLPYQPDFLTQNPATLRVLEVARSVADSDATVLIGGESGTGKSLLAKLIHESSRRQAQTFVSLDCTSLQESLLESELFGHKRGAFTGAVEDKVGKVERAHHGTLFLDEIGEIPLHLQGKLLRLVEERTFERVGDPVPRTVDARIIAATHRDLGDQVQERTFREDLYYRLSVVELTLPALRHRPEDIPLLAGAFLKRANDAHRRQVQGWEPAVESALMAHAWPGNVRELANAMERAVLLATGPRLTLANFADRLRIHDDGHSGDTGILPLAVMEERHMRAALGQGLSLEETARNLGINPSTLWRKRKKYGI